MLKMYFRLFMNTKIDGIYSNMWLLTTWIFILIILCIISHTLKKVIVPISAQKDIQKIILKILINELFLS